VVLLFEDELDDSAGVYRHERGVVLDKSIGTTRHYFDLVAFAGIAGIATRRPSKVESAKSLENITSVS